MRTWTRSAITRRCGLCSNAIKVADPILLLTIAGLKTPRVRCATCAGEEMPADLPPVPDRSTTGGRLSALPVMKRLGLLPMDEREPGEEG